MRFLKMVFVVIAFQFSFTPSTLAATQHAKADDLKVYFIDVGQGDSVLVQTPNHKNILIDGGPPKAGKKVVRFLRDHGVKRLDLLVATHPDIDHIGGLNRVLKSVHIDRVLESGKLHSTRTYMRYVHQLHKQKIPVKLAHQGDKIDLDSALNIEILNAYMKYKNNNQSSIVLKIRYHDARFLLMADAEIGQEEEMLEEGKDVQADIYKVGHHGSNTSTSLPFLNTVKPKIAILPYSQRNHYGHPVNRVIRNLTRMNVAIYSTEVYGNILIQTNGEHYFVFTEKTPFSGLYHQAI